MADATFVGVLIQETYELVRSNVFHIEQRRGMVGEFLPSQLEAMNEQF